MPNRSIGRYLALGALGLVGYQIVSRTYNAAREAEDKAQAPFKRISIVDGTVAHLANEGGESPEQEHRRKEENYWLWTKVAAVVAAVGAIVAAVFAGGAFYQALRQADAAEEGNRAWIAISGFEIDSISVRKGKVILSGNVHFSNVGKSPAQNVEQKLGIIPNRIFNVTATKAFCENEKEQRRSLSFDPLDIAFPEAKETRSANGVDDVDAFIKADIEAGHEFYNNFIKPLLKQNEIDSNAFREASGTDKNDHAVYEFVVIGCTTYKSGSVKDAMHGTGFSYRVSTKETDPKKMGFFFGSDFLMRGKELILEKTATGAYAD